VPIPIANHPHSVLVVLDDAVTNASVRRERAELEERGIAADDAPRVLAYRYRCEYAGCPASTLFPDGLTVPPVLAASTPVCPMCAQPLVTLGPRRASVEVKLTQHGVEQLRIVVEDGRPVELGRTAEIGTASLAALRADPSAVSLLSRRHLRLHCDGERRLWIEDLGSTNGTSIVRLDEQDGRLIEAGALISVNHGDRVVLPDDVELTLSGRSYPLLAGASTTFVADDERTVRGASSTGTGG
jgi:pSer/pThr/pTyr-binding forkhead associated (FHA) protein